MTTPGQRQRPCLPVGAPIQLRLKFTYTGYAMVRSSRIPVTLTDSDRVTLLSWTRSRTGSRALAQRAQIVLMCEQGLANTAVAEELGISRDMVATWRSRYLADGLDGLHERSRPGRPAKSDADTVAQVLVRLLAPSPSEGRDWSTRSMAAETGLSQATVNRIWRRYQLQSRPGRLPADGGRTSLRSARVRDVIGLFLGPPTRVLAVVADSRATPLQHRGATTSTPAAPMSRRATKARNILAVANALALVRGRPDTRDPAVPCASLGVFLETLDQRVAAGSEVHLLVGGEPNSPARDTVETWVRHHPHFHRHLVATDASWLDEVEVLLAKNPLLTHENVPGFATSTTALRDGLRAWCGTWTPQSDPFTWMRLDKDSTASESTQEGRPADSDDHESTDEATGITPEATDTAGSVVHLVREALLADPFPPGERVKEAPLASRLGVSRGAVREALRVLAEEGMLDRLPHRGVAAPQVDVTTVLDLYAVRAVLGTVLMRRVAMLNRSELRPVDTALSEVHAAVRRSDPVRIGEADLRFQDAIARTAGLPQASLFFQRLSMRLRMFISILQLDFTDAGADLIARENTAIFEAILNGDGDEAARLWRVKVERSTRYMANLLPQAHFDPALWVAIAGRPVPRPGDTRNTSTSSTR
ncbi:helix-turn-helix domain-containing protein [Streptomyces sp. NBC_00140]|uniref:helix-turn-helix domain-containing protein n=1 Tax=Streptomyces sp. NBC_00140 TaxID=2975664 RepID=UPI00225441D5|nr:helix-turn-helix domain-containing protein [Streptomyces sp. NBC_00140]MCX5336384.1 helix-turn-helix domain-containing protein [Streptomyces sp. NBC_00140]